MNGLLLPVKSTVPLFEVTKCPHSVVERQQEPCACLSGTRLHDTAAPQARWLRVSSEAEPHAHDASTMDGAGPGSAGTNISPPATWHTVSTELCWNAISLVTECLAGAATALGNEEYKASNRSPKQRDGTLWRILPVDYIVALSAVYQQQPATSAWQSLT